MILYPALWLVFSRTFLSNSQRQDINITIAFERSYYEETFFVIMGILLRLAMSLTMYGSTVVHLTKIFVWKETINSFELIGGENENNNINNHDSVFE